MTGTLAFELFQAHQLLDFLVNSQSQELMWPQSTSKAFLTLGIRNFRSAIMDMPVNVPVDNPNEDTEWYVVLLSDALKLNLLII